MITSVVLSLILAALTGTATVNSKGINPVQHSEARSSETTTNYTAKPPNPVQHSE